MIKFDDKLLKTSEAYFKCVTNNYLLQKTNIF